MTYEREILTALYKILDYNMCNDIETESISKQIDNLEEKIKNAN